MGAQPEEPKTALRASIAVINLILHKHILSLPLSALQPALTRRASYRISIGNSIDSNAQTFTTDRHFSDLDVGTIIAIELVEGDL